MSEQEFSNLAAHADLPDPAVPAHAVRAISTSGVRAFAHLATRAYSTANLARFNAIDGQQALAGAWNSPQVQTRIDVLVQGFDTFIDNARASSSATTTFADSINDAQQAVRDAYSHAEDALARAMAKANEASPIEGLNSVISTTQAEINGIVTRLRHHNESAAQHLDTAAQRFIMALPPDPLGQFPPALSRLPGEGRVGMVSDLERHTRGRLNADLQSSDPLRRRYAAHVQQALIHAQDNNETVQLLQYDPDHPPGQGSVAFSVGDIATADSVSVLVPGLENSPSDAAGLADRATDLKAASESAAAGSSSASIVWIGYDVPASWGKDPGTGNRWKDAALSDLDYLRAVNSRGAEKGGTELAGFCTNLRAMLPTSAALTLVGHSYGSTVVSEAALRMGPDDGVDDIVLLASPGAGQDVPNAAAYQAVDEDHVHTLSFDHDPVTNSITDAAAGFANGLLGQPGGLPFGPDPASADFGALNIDAPTNTPAHVYRPEPKAPFDPLDILGHNVVNIGKNFDQHALSNYLSGSALESVGAVVAGQYSHVEVRPGR